MTRFWIKIFAVPVLSISVVAVAQQIVNQGRPGTQGPWPVTVTGGGGSTTYDGGNPSAATGVICNKTIADGGSPQQVTAVGLIAVPVPASASPGRYYMTVCNSTENSGTPQVKCLYNGVAPVMGKTTKGDVLGLSDCWRFDISSNNVLECISDTAATAVTSDECVP